MHKVDLHTHSIASHDGGISAINYKRCLELGKLNTIAVTDHNKIDFALELRAELGNKIIVGEEIMTTKGEIIGLYLEKLVPPGLSPQETIACIKDQGGLVYIPHPFETVRKGLHPAILDNIVKDIDIVEVCNGRAFLQNFGGQAIVWSRLNQVLQAASSDAHGYYALGRTYTSLAEEPTKESLCRLLLTCTRHTRPANARILLYPKMHTLRKRLWKK